MPREKKPPTESVRIAKDIARMAGMVARRTDKSVPDLLDEIIRPVITAKYEAVVREMAAEIGVKPPKK